MDFFLSSRPYLHKGQGSINKLSKIYRLFDLINSTKNLKVSIILVNECQGVNDFKQDWNYI